MAWPHLWQIVRGPFSLWKSWHFRHQKAPVFSHKTKNPWSVQFLIYLCAFPQPSATQAGGRSPLTLQNKLFLSQNTLCQKLLYKLSPIFPPQVHLEVQLFPFFLIYFYFSWACTRCHFNEIFHGSLALSDKFRQRVHLSRQEYLK